MISSSDLRSSSAFAKEPDQLDEERLMELSWSMSNSERTEFDVIRNGKPIKLASQPGAAR